jgi:hypothetical protein
MVLTFIICHTRNLRARYTANSHRVRIIPTLRWNPKIPGHPLNKDTQERQPPQLNHILIVQIYQIICSSVSGHTRLNCLYLNSIFQMSTVWPYVVKLY